MELQPLQHCLTCRPSSTLLRLLNKSTIVDVIALERIINVGGISAANQLHSSGTIAANLCSNFGPGHFGFGRRLLSIGIDICFIFGFYQIFNLFGFWTIKDLEFGFWTIDLNSQCPSR